MNIAYDLFLLMFNLSQIRDKKRIITIFVEGMNDVFKLVDLSFSLDDDSADILHIEIRTRESRFGFITISKSDSLSEENFVLLRNSIQMLAVILENRKYESVLQDEKRSLELLADERLAEMKQLITDLQTEIKKRTKSEQYLRRLIEKSPFPIAVTEKDNKIELFNEIFTRLFGYTTDDIPTVEEWWITAYPDKKYREKVQKDWNAGIESARQNKTDFEPQRWEIVIKDGSRRDCDFFMVPLGTKKLIVVQDITERKQSEEELMSLLEEKDYLMREINHRIKNNLNMISSLISLKHTETDLDLTDLKNQIEAIRIVHEKLSQTEKVRNIEAKEYLENLLITIFSNFSAYDVEIKLSVGEITLPSITAVPIGLIVNEMATNAIKYGFSSDEKAWFSVNLEKNSTSGFFKLTVSNSGRPIPAHINLDNPETIGLRLISALVHQIDGTVDLKKQPNPEFTIKFPEPEEQDSSSI